VTTTLKLHWGKNPPRRVHVLAQICLKEKYDLKNSRFEANIGD
jgi:hypothetical protein